MFNLYVISIPFMCVSYMLHFYNRKINVKSVHVLIIIPTIKYGINKLVYSVMLFLTFLLVLFFLMTYIINIRKDITL